MAEPQNTRTRTRSYSRMHPAPNLGARRVRKIGVAVGAVFALGACSGESDAASVPTVHLEPTTSSTAAPTTTTTEAVPTTEDPAVAYERDVAEITAVYTLNVDFLVDHGLNPDPDRIAEFAAEPLLSRKIANIQSLVDQGFRVGAKDAAFEVVDLTIIGDTATLTTCELDGISILSNDGQTVVPADTEWGLWTTSLRLVDAQWRITDSAYTNQELTSCA